METNEGPASIELWPNNMLIVSQSFDDDTLGKLRPMVINGGHTTAASDYSERELSSKFYELDGFVALQEQRSNKLFERIMKFAIK